MLIKNTNNNNETNFWLSYADLMAGLLFIFILLIGAIIVKSIVLKSNLASKETSLESSQQTLFMRDKEIQKLKKLLTQRSIEIDKSKHKLYLKEKTLQLKTQEIQTLNKILLAKKMTIDHFNQKIIIMQNLLNESNKTVTKQNIKLADYENRVIILSKNLTKKDETLKLKDEKLLKLLMALQKKDTQYDLLIQKLQKQKAQIKTLTGIKIKVIAELKKTLKDKVQIDPKSGSLRLSSNILFDKGSFTLKDSAKTELKKVFIQYIGTLISNKTIKNQIDKIIIEGHTDSDGDYLYNLNLSQKRAFAVMNYLLSLKFTKEHNLQPLLVASGRSYIDPIVDDKGEEIKSASRRIEIKFRLKNDDALQEIDKILDYE